MQQFVAHPKSRTFTPRPQKKAYGGQKPVPQYAMRPKAAYNPPIMIPKTDHELNLLIHVRNWHEARADLKEDGKRHQEMVRRISIVIEAYDG